jgi:hypothetical protein
MFPVPSTIVAGPAVSKVDVPTGLIVINTLLGWANFGDNTLRCCTIGNSPCQSTVVGNRTSSQVNGPGFIWAEVSNP